MVIRAISAALLSACAAWALPSCADPVHDDAVRVLGPEDPSVPPGPLHRPGQPCVTCHGGSGPASRRLSLGGTVYAVRGEKSPAVGAVVRIEDIDGKSFSASTNSAGNFYTLPATASPHYPIQMTVRSLDGTVVQQMLSPSQRDGSCADCHVDPQSPRSPGTVYLSTVDLDGGTE
jgi:hypothetical protein